MNNMDNSQEEKSNFDRNKYIRKIQPEKKYSGQNINESQELSTQENQDFQESKEPFDKSKYKRSFLSKYIVPGRHVTRTASRISETVAGLPGNLIQGAKYIGSLLPDPPEFLKKDPNFIQKYGKEALEHFPTSQEIKKASEDYFGLWTTAQGEKEKLGDEFIETATNLMIPLGQQQSWLRSTAAAGGGVLSKQLAKEYGAPEWAQEAVKFATTLGISVFNPGGAREFSNNLYTMADRAIPDHISVPGQNVVNELSNMRANLARGGGEHAASSGEVINWIDRVLQHITDNGGRLNVKEGQSFLRNINEAMGDPANLERARQLYPVVNRYIREGMQQVEGTFPEYWNLLTNANESHGAIAQGAQIGYRVEEAIKKSPLKSNLGVLMAAAAYNPLAAVGYVAGRGLVEAVDILSQFARSPTLRRYYNDMFRHALNDNKTALLADVKRIDKEASKEEAKDKKKEKGLKVKFDLEEEKKLNPNR